MPVYRNGNNNVHRFDPAVAEHMDYSDDELEFLRAMDKYKQSTGYQFPTLAETLQVVRSLGYEKPPEGSVPGPHLKRPIKSPGNPQGGNHGTCETAGRGKSGT
jgi:hypothetical protein